MHLRIRDAGLCLLVLTMLSLTGCFTTEFTLGSPDEAKTSRIYVGDWQFENDKAPLMSIRNFDGKSYVVQLVDKDNDSKNKPEWYRGFVSDVKDVSFAHLQKLNADGTLGDKWELHRIAITDAGELVLRPLSEKYFSDKSIKSNDDLRKVVEAGLDDDAMYEKEILKAKRVSSGE